MNELEKLASEKIGKKQFSIGYTKAINETEKTVEGYVSTWSFDRMEERFAQGAFDLTNYQKNPVVLWGHDHDKVIGKAVSMSEDEVGLFSKTKFDQGNIFAMEKFGLYQRGFLNAFSVGFIPKEFILEPMPNDPERKGLVWTKAELLEYSAVSIPANPGALVSRAVADLARKAIGEDAVALVKAFGKEQFVVMPQKPEELNEKELSGILRALKPESGEPDLSEGLKLIGHLARTVKGKKVDPDKLSLLKTTADLFYSIIEENTDGVSGEEFNALKKSVETLATSIEEMYPDYVEQVRKAMLEVKRAI